MTRVLRAAASVALTTSDGVRLAARHYDSGQRELVGVLAHGFTGSSRTPAVRRIAERLVTQSMSVFVPDLRGHGDSEGFCTAGDVEVHDIAASVEWLRAAGYERVVLLGWSMGGSVVLRFAGLGGDADAIVSISSPGTWFERGTRSMRVVHWLCETRSGRLACRVVRGTRLSAAGWQIVPEAPVEVIAQIAPRPLLLVHGENDHYFPVRHIHALAAAAPGAEVWIEPGMGHAETATTPELLDRISRWVHAVCDSARSGQVCDDDDRD